MINVPFDVLADRIVKEAGISRGDLDSRVDSKLEQLSGLISREGAAHIIANELGVNLLKADGLLKIKDLLPGMKNVKISGRVVRKYEARSFQNEKRSGRLARFLLGDDSGVTMVVLWNDHVDLLEKFKEGDVVRLGDCAARENNGRVELHLSDSGSLSVNPEGVEVKAAPQRGERVRRKISELKEGDSEVEVFATVVQVFDPKFFEVCPSCNKRVRKDESSNAFKCVEHGEVKPAYGVVLNLFVDDGSDNIRVVLWRSQVAALLCVDDEKIDSFRESQGSFEDFKTDLLGLMAKFVGRVSKNQMFDRLEFVAGLVFRDVDPEEELKNVEGSPSKEAVPVKAEEDDEDLMSLEDLEEELVD